MSYPKTQAGEIRGILLRQSARDFAAMLRAKYPTECGRLTAARLGKIERGDLPGTEAERRCIVAELGFREWEVFPK